MRIRKHFTYANLMATIAAFSVVGGGGAYAVSRIDTTDIANKAVTAKKLDSRAVTAKKLGSGVVTGNKIARSAVESRNLSLTAPVPIAGATVVNDAVSGWFNRLNDQKPAVTHTQVGVYHLRIPGIEGKFTASELLSSATLAQGSQPGEISVGLDANSAGEDLHPIIYTFDSNGNPADRVFVFFLYRAEHDVVGQ